MNKPKIGFVSLGCPKNQIDTEVMLKELSDAGYEITAEDISADIIVINTCAFIESAKKEAIDNILDIAMAQKAQKAEGNHLLWLSCGKIPRAGLYRASGGGCCRWYRKYTQYCSGGRRGMEGQKIHLLRKK